MIERYTLPQMAELWSLQAKYQTWLEVELAALEVMEQLGEVPPGISAEVRAKAGFDIARIDEIELEVKHDVIAFLTSVAEFVGEHSRHVHKGMTSSDLIDTALSLQIGQAGKLLLQKTAELKQTVLRRALEHKRTVMVGRSHGIHGEPITFGIKLLVWVDELERHEKRIADALEENRIGQFSGAMGTYSNISPEVERRVCEKLGLKPARTSTQVIQRDIHAQFIVALGSLASSLEKFAVELRHLQRTDVLEVEEAFSKGQKGSSAMPHKRNPISGENITGLARLVRSYTIPVLENIALWHERDISHSSVERVIFPDACILTHYMLSRMTTLIGNLVVYPDNMLRNMNVYGSAILSQRVLLALVDKGLSREEAYRLVQVCAHKAWNTPDGNFRENVFNHPEIQQAMSVGEIEACFNVEDYLRHVDEIFARFEAEVAQV